MNATTKKAPVSAFALSVGAYEFAESSPESKTGPITLTASSGQAFNHWYWGRMVFDFAGMRMAKDKLTLDYCHREDEVVGYVDRFDASEGKLSVSGEIVSAMSNDRAAEILVKGKAGVPYEASMKFDPSNGLVIEEYAEGELADVNGTQIPGPLAVVRKCLLRGIAVCPYGMDPYTESQFSAQSAGEVDVQIHRKEDAMSDVTKPEEKTAEQIRAELAAQSQDYVNRFGELGAKWFAENKPLIDCYAEFTAKLNETHAAELQARDEQHAALVTELKAKVTAAEVRATEAEQRLASLSLGETQPVSGTPDAGKKEVPTSLSLAIGDNLAKFAAGMKLPTQKAQA